MKNNKTKLSGERGVALIAEIILVVVVLAALATVGAIAYQKKTGQSLVSSVLPAKYTLSSKCVYNDPDLCRFFNNTTQFKAFTASIASADSTGTFQLDDSGNFHLTTTMNGRENYNYIAIGATSYTRDYNGAKWLKQTISADTQKQNDQTKSDFDLQAAADSTTQYQKRGTEACGSLKCFKYQVITGDATTTEYIWFDIGDYKLRKLESISNGVTSDVTYTYDSPSITAPSPTESASSN